MVPSYPDEDDEGSTLLADDSDTNHFHKFKEKLDDFRTGIKEQGLDYIKGLFKNKQDDDDHIEEDQYHVASHDLLSYTPSDGWDEIERYWVDEPYSFISILKNPVSKSVYYQVVEPELTKFELVLFEDVKMLLEDMLTLKKITDFENMTFNDKIKLLRENTYLILRDYSQDDPVTLEKISYYIKRNFIDHGKISPMMNDRNIEDIWCNGVGLPIHVYHTGYRNMETNVKYSSADELNAYVMRIAQQGGRHLSTSTPILDTVMAGGSRINITYTDEVSPKGTSFTIRRIKSTPISPLDLIVWKTFTSDIMAYFWMCMENHKSILFCGGTATGKTSTMNAISMFIPQDVRIVSLEDTKEIQLPHSNWVSTITRENMPGMEIFQIDLEDLLRAALRQRPEYLLVGEVRGREAQILFQAMNAGHATCSTFHAGNTKEVINRFTHAPINVPVPMFSALDVICILTTVYKEGTEKRRVLEVNEIEDVTETIQIHTTYEWNEPTDSYNFSYSHILEQIKDKRGYTHEELAFELDQKKKFLDMLTEKGIRDYDNVVKWIQEYNKHGHIALTTLSQYESFHVR